MLRANTLIGKIRPLITGHIDDKVIFYLSRNVNTDINIFNCISKKKEPLLLKHENVVTWYTCGPTVYDSAHLGHASCYVKLDIIQRILQNHFGLNLVKVMNITDVDDKLINRSREKNISVPELAKSYEKEFWCDMNNLNVLVPSVMLRVTDHIDLIKQFILQLEQSGQAYKAEDGSVYFDVANCSHYGKFRDISKIEFSKDKIKKSPMDFALWKSSKNEEISWDSPWGRGRPGWHIECSTLASLAFGNRIDIHAGGVDLQFPHHENEEAQSCAFHNTNQWVNFWLHTGHLHLKDSIKMSKSLKNTISIQEMLKSVNPDTFRMACFMSHYRNNMEYSDEYMQAAESVLCGFRNFFQSCKDYLDGHLKANVDSNKLMGLLSDLSVKTHSAYCDDFNTPQVVKYLNELVSTTNVMLHSTSVNTEISPLFPVAAVNSFVKQRMIEVGFELEDRKSASSSENSQTENEIVDILCNFRQDVRQLGRTTKNLEILKLCDTVRDNMKKVGFAIKDYGEKSSCSKT